MNSSNTNLKRFWSPKVHDLSPYVPGEQPKLTNLVKLNTNENPFPPSPKVFVAIQNQLNQSLRLYPDPNATKLRQCLADSTGLNIDNVFVGNGSDEVLAHTFQALLKHSEPLLFPDISYSFYPVYCGLYGIKKCEVPLSEDLTINVSDFSQPNGGVILPNPNAPTGELLSLMDIRQLLMANTNRVVVIDEAYIDFGGQSAAILINQYANLLVVQTMSKARSLAGMRIGYALGSVQLIEGLERVKNSFNSYPLGHLQIAAGIAAFEDQTYFDDTRNQVMASREWLSVQLKALHFDVLPSAANFVFVRPTQKPAETIADQLRDLGIIVRHFKQPRIEEFLRITVGTEAQNRQLINALASLLK